MGFMRKLRWAASAFASFTVACGGTMDDTGSDVDGIKAESGMTYEAPCSGRFNVTSPNGIITYTTHYAEFALEGLTPQHRLSANVCGFVNEARDPETDERVNNVEYLDCHANPDITFDGTAARVLCGTTWDGAVKWTTAYLRVE